MFGTLSSLVQAANPQAPPTDVPPPTDIHLPCCHPQLSDPDKGAEAPPAHLVRLIQTLYRPPQLDDSHFRALGVHVHKDAPSEQVVPNPALLPQETGWDDMTPELAADANKHFQRPLSNGNNSPDARIYCDRRRELSADNQAAFRTLRRIKPEAGKQAIRLGGSYEFFKQMDLMAGYWDDTSLPLESEDASQHDVANRNGPESRPSSAVSIPHPIDASLDQAAHALVAAATGSEQKAHDDAGKARKGPEKVVYRTAPGSQMPASFRHDMVGAFIKLVAYDFGCNITQPRVEPRLYIRTPSSPSSATHRQPPPSQAGPSSSETTLVPDPASVSRENNPAKEAVVSHFPSGCTFLTRTPTTREAARAGIVEGPVLSISIRNATSFASTSTIRGASPSNNDNLDSKLDFGRELVAALATAQLRNREGKDEVRVGEAKWWASRPRWGGGEGGSIGREVDGEFSIQGDKDAPVPSPDRNTAPGRSGGSTTRSPRTLSPSSSSSSLSPPPSSHSSSSPSRRSPNPSPSGSRSGRSSSRGQPAAKRTRKTMSIYDNYRMIRKPASNWDKKTRYMTIGKRPGVDYDDIFVLSSLFHHFSVLRVRVPKALLDVLDGNIESFEKGGKEAGSWGKLEIWRSKWFDLFIPSDRLEALRLLWGVMMWQMRKTDDEERAASTATSSSNSNAAGSAPGTAGDQKRKSVDIVMRDADAGA